MNARRRARKLQETVFRVLMGLSMAAVLLCLLAIVVVILWRSLPALRLSMLFETPKGGYYLGKEGGIANAIVGSLYLGFGGIALAALVGLPTAFALQREFGGPRLTRAARLALDILWGTPSIVYGAFAFLVMRHFGLRASLLGGIGVLALLMLPILVRTVEEVIRLVPVELKEISYALGATRLETTLRVVRRQVLPGIVMGVLLAFGRGIGDAASILFTAGYTDSLPRSLFDPVASLPLAVFFQIGTPVPEVQQRAYAAALVLLVIVLVVSLGARWIGHRLSRFVVR